MSITIQQQPPAFCPAYNELIFVITSTQTGQPNFKFVCDIWLEGAGSYLARVKINTRPGTSQAVFDAHRIIENYLSEDIGIGAGFAKNNKSYTRFFIKFGEEYGSTPVVYDSLTTSAIRTAYNGIFDFNDWIGYNYTDWQLIKGATKNCLSNAPLTQYIEANQSLNLYFAPSGANTVEYLMLKQYTSNNNLIGLDGVIYNSYTAATDYHQRIGIGTRELSIGNDTDHYTVQLFDDTDSPVSKLYTIYQTCNPKYTTQRIHFQNKLGGFDAFNFTAIHRKNTNITRESYQKNTGALSGGSWVITKMDRGLTDFDVKMTDSLHLISGWLTEEQSTWLEEMFSSPNIWLEVKGELLPFVVTSNTYSSKQKEADKLINIEIDIQPSVMRRRQRG